MDDEKKQPSHLTPRELAARYPEGVLNTETLKQWRCKSSSDQSPRWIKAGGKVVYSPAEVEAWERRQDQPQQESDESPTT
jgi:hypothetical protein